MAVLFFVLFGLTSAAETSPAAYLASVAAAAARQSAVFAPFRAAACPLPADSLLHGWLADSMTLMLQGAPSASKAGLLPKTAADFFAFYANAKPSVSSTLQHALSMRASSHSYKASLTAAQLARRDDGGAAIAHLCAITATSASAWKRAAPTQPMATLHDVQYRLAARLNLRLPPFPAADDVPERCDQCKAGADLRHDVWHALACNSQRRREVTTRHNTVVSALHHVVLVLGGQSVQEPIMDGLRPDLQIVFPGLHLLTDVVIANPLRAGVVPGARGTARLVAARTAEQYKIKKYNTIATRHHAALLPFAVEVCGGMGDCAADLLDRIASAGAEQFGFWSHSRIVQHLLAVVAVAIQKGNAMTALAWHESVTLRPSTPAVWE